MIGLGGYYIGTTELNTIPNLSNSYTWTVDQPSGSDMIFQVTDANGEVGYIQNVRVGGSGDASCLDASAAGSSAAASASASASAAAGAGASETGSASAAGYGGDGGDGYTASSTNADAAAASTSTVDYANAAPGMLFIP